MKNLAPIALTSLVFLLVGCEETKKELQKPSESIETESSKIIQDEEVSATKEKEGKNSSDNNQVFVEVENIQKDSVDSSKAELPNKDDLPKDEPKEDLGQGDKEQESDSCQGYAGFLADRSWKSVYGSLTTKLKKDIDLVFDHSSIGDDPIIMSSKFSNQPSENQPQECGEMTLIAPATYKKMSFGSPVLCHGFLENPNKDNWTCEPISKALRALNDQNCPIADEYNSALACAPKDTSVVDYKVDENPCRGNKAKGKKATLELIMKGKREMNGYYGDSEIVCQTDIRAKCADFKQEDVENFTNYVNCGAKHKVENKTCLGFPEDLNTYDTVCYLDDLSEQRMNHESCGEQYRCFLK